MAVTTRPSRAPRPVDGPQVARVDDIPQLNEVFAEAFTERYRKDGLTGVRVPPLNPAIWQYAIADAGDGALIWRDDRARVVAFNMVHLAGSEGWMGPLCVRPDHQGAGLGKLIVQAGMRWLRARHAKVIGLETMPRTMDNIGFYSTLGFLPGHLTVTLTIDARLGERPATLLSALPMRDQQRAIDACRTLTATLVAGYDFTREIALTAQYGLGDTLLLGDPVSPIGYALCHTAPLVEGRVRDELRVLKLVLARRAELPRMVGALVDYARRSGTRRLAVRLQGEYPDAYRTLIALGARVRWTDLRMSAHGWTEVAPSDGMLLSNWEI